MESSDVEKSKQRELIIQKMNAILGLDEKNNKLLIYKLKNDVEKQQQIIALDKEIKECFNTTNWSYYMGMKINKNYLSLIKYVYKNMGYFLEKKEVRYKENDKIIRKHCYVITKIVHK